MISKLIIHLFLIVSMLPSSVLLKLDKKVYICNGPKSKRYHYDEDCRGLKKCSTKTYPISLEEAKEEGRTLCGYED